MIDFLKFMADLNLDPEPYENEPWFKAEAEAKAKAKAEAKAVVSSFNITDEKNDLVHHRFLRLFSGSRLLLRA